MRIEEILKGFQQGPASRIQHLAYSPASRILHLVERTRSERTGVADILTRVGSYSRRSLERHTIEGKSPVDEMAESLSILQSTTRHVKPCGKQGGPPPKAKYYLVTDRE